MLPNSSSLLLVIALAVFAVGEILKPPKPIPPPVQISLDQFQSKYGRRYANQEQKIFRRIVLESNKKIINDHNKRLTRTYNLGENQFVDLTSEQFIKKYTGLIPTTKRIREHIKDITEAQNLDKGECFCKPSQALRRFQLEKKIAKNQQQYEKTIQKKLDKNSKVDFSIQELINLSKNISKTNLSKLSATTLRFNPIASSTTFLSLQQPLIVNQTLSVQQFSLDNFTLAEAPNSFFSSAFPDVDWTNKTGPVRHQGNCGACYAFTSVQVLEAANSIFLFDGLHIALSVQQIMDCAIPYINYNGCNGGLIEWGYTFMKYNGVTSNFRYPYISGQTGNTSSCKNFNGQFKIVDYKQLNGSCSHLRQELQRKPVSTAVKAANMRFYTSGVFDNCMPNDYFNHAVVIVGFNSNIGWKFKNTWGLSWGEAGYGWLSLDQSKNCGICVAPVVPLTRGEI